MLEQVIDELRAAWPERAIEADSVSTRPVDCDRGRHRPAALEPAGQRADPWCLGRAGAGAAAAAGVFELSVTNAGEPIPPAARALFQPFFRASVRPGQQGLGLGLYIASEIARAHGGTLEASSTPADHSLHVPNADLTRFPYGGTRDLENGL